MIGALLDTSYLITLSDATRANHLTAKKYYVEMINRRVTMYLSTIVISEFEVKQRITDLGLRNFIVLPFNVDHAMAAASLTEIALKIRDSDYARNTVKDDVKLLGQCEISGITHFLTDDEKCVGNLKKLAVKFSPRTLPAGVFCGDAYTDTWFNPGNQGSFDL